MIGLQLAAESAEVASTFSVLPGPDRRPRC